MEIREILKENNFRFNKALGQNFITDKNLLNAIVTDSAASEEDVIVEIGAGAGTLTRAIAERCKKVYAFEVDDNLRPVLKKSLEGLDNVTVVFADVLKMSDEELLKIVDKPFKVIANLPYYITTPLIMRFLESSLPVLSLTVTIQKEVAERLVAKAGKPEYGAVTVAADYAGDAVITRIIGKEMFFPVPKVDSALLTLAIIKDKYNVNNEKLFKRTVKAAFLWRRKTLANNLQNMFSLPKSECEKILASCGFSPMIRGEKLTTQEFINLSEEIEKHLKK
ncbi:MAG: 16S rRNA (adenine(1518)-N(6)/adenine(1519)-N(6))-dimethyltransferase RsmA [Eubacteriales bacterium]|nr:16S rRNA (adenine(1518)-N(6)/adenine(1519)-N(6))-dimethyltransferase RsmA [Eubacteriales bacterium]